jgi:hypothetical protein
MISMPSAELDAEIARALAHAVLAADQQRRTEPSLTKLAAARITCSSSPSAKTTRCGRRRSRS